MLQYTYHGRKHTNSATRHSLDYPTSECSCSGGLGTTCGNHGLRLRCDVYPITNAADLAIGTAGGRTLAIGPVADIRVWAADEVREGGVAVRVL